MDKMNVELDVLLALVMYRISRHVDRQYIVTKHDGGLGDGAMKLDDQLT